MLDLHVAPPEARLSEGVEHKTRYVFRKWPRDPKGQVTVDVVTQGKTASNGLPLWGATLYDFYYVHRIPDCPNYVTRTTGSKLAECMRKIGELDVAAPEIAWADMEEAPREIHPCDVGRLIEDYEMHPFAEFADRSQFTASEGKSIFDKFTHPPPWPAIPFSGLRNPPKLQKRLPFHLLPQKLVVHDPWDCLSAKPPEDDGKEWKEKDDIIHTYVLKLSSEGKETVERHRKKATEATDSDPTPHFIMQPDPLEPNGPPGAPYIVCVSPKPALTTIPEAHLYLSPTHQKGEGNHSIVYEAELEVPKSLLVEEKMCEKCIFEALESKYAEDVEKLYEEEREALLTGKKIAKITTVEICEPEMICLEEYGTCTKETAAQMEPGHDMPASEESELLEKPNEGTAEGTSRQTKGDRDEPGICADDKGSNSYEIHCEYSNPGKTVVMNLDGPVKKINVDVPWQNPERAPYCKHLRPNGKGVPPTATVCVAAKLSIEHDDHLGNEARNYQKFPDHFFEHYNGYNVVDPLHDPVPCGALVPQFYGYYIPLPDENDKGSQGSRSGNRRYLSPILLLEDCGSPIDAKRLNLDDRQECAALLYRFHHEGWNHDSFAERNIVVQSGPIKEFPLFRNKKIFRLIDFGRSWKRFDPRHRAIEEMRCQELLYVGLYKRALREEEEEGLSDST